MWSWRRRARTRAPLGDVMQRARVFARVEPRQKLLIVENLQKAGHIVAVTGDGVNDAPALRRADIGVAMGRSGTDIARDAADLVVTDDNFASIVDGVEEGRIVLDNVRKILLMVLSTGAAEILIFVLALLSGLPLPLVAVQLLWLNLVTNGIQDVALAFEKGEGDVLRRRPRPPSAPLLDRALVEQIVVYGAAMGTAAVMFFAWCLGTGRDEFEARNATLLLMVLFENILTLACRSESPLHLLGSDRTQPDGRPRRRRDACAPHRGHAFDMACRYPADRAGRRQLVARRARRRGGGSWF